MGSRLQSGEHGTRTRGPYGPPPDFESGCLPTGGTLHGGNVQSRTASRFTDRYPASNRGAPTGRRFHGGGDGSRTRRAPSTDARSISSRVAVPMATPPETGPRSIAVSYDPCGEGELGDRNGSVTTPTIRHTAPGAQPDKRVRRTVQDVLAAIQALADRLDIYSTSGSGAPSRITTNPSHSGSDTTRASG